MNASLPTGTPVDVYMPAALSPHLPRVGFAQNNRHDPEAIPNTIDAIVFLDSRLDVAARSFAPVATLLNVPLVGSRAEGASLGRTFAVEKTIAGTVRSVAELGEAMASIPLPKNLGHMKPATKG